MFGLPANRVAAIITGLTGFGAFVASIEGVLPGRLQTTALAVAGIATQLAVTLKFLEGSQRHDALLQTGAAVASDFAVLRDAPKSPDGAPASHDAIEKEIQGLPDPGADIAPPPEKPAPAPVAA